MNQKDYDPRLYDDRKKFEKMLQELPAKRGSQVLERSQEEIDTLVEELLGKMTLEEKLGQMSQSVGGSPAPIGEQIQQELSVEEQIEQGLVGSVILMSGPEQAYHYQKLAVEQSRLHIPLLFCKDIIHGCQTVFPIPLGWSCSFDPVLVQEAAHVAAREATALGVACAFAPMLDIARDPRWGRVAEGNGEDPYLCSCMCEAVVRGYQGENLTDKDSMMACLKHYIGYSAAEGGRDYNTCEISETTLRNVYLKPFEAGIHAGAASVMSSFNLVNGVPVTGNRYVLRDILRRELGFTGIVISDYGAVQELIVHGAAEDEGDAARKALEASLDIEMATGFYNRCLAAAIREERVPQCLVDEAVRRILSYKYRTGLMDDPYKTIRPEAMKEVFGAPCREAALSLARESMVLLKNGIAPAEHRTALPLRRGQRIALIGPKGDSKDLLGPWQTSAYGEETVTILEGLKALGCQVVCVPGCGIHEESQEGMKLALEAAGQADVVLLALGESRDMSGEAASRQSITVPRAQMKLAQAVTACARKQQKAVVTVLVNGRPLLLNWFAEHTDAILEAWFPGCEGGRAIAELLLGDYNPSGRLSISIPAAAGQIPVYYNHFNTGRPFEEGMGGKYLSRYLDGPNAPLYAFGYGLSYTSFRYERLALSSDTLHPGERLEISVQVSNVGDREGETVVQLYLWDVSASIVRPVKELKGFQRIYLEPGECRMVQFQLGEEELSFYNQEGRRVAEPGRFWVYVGSSSRDLDLLGETFFFIE